MNECERAKSGIEWIGMEWHGMERKNRRYSLCDFCSLANLCPLKLVHRYRNTYIPSWHIERDWNITKKSPLDISRTGLSVYIVQTHTNTHTNDMNLTSVLVHSLLLLYTMCTQWQ